MYAWVSGVKLYHFFEKFCARTIWITLGQTSKKCPVLYLRNGLRTLIDYVQTFFQNIDYALFPFEHKHSLQHWYIWVHSPFSAFLNKRDLHENASMSST